MENGTVEYVDGLPTIKVLDKGFVILEDFMGGDLRTVNAAKVSNKKRSKEVGPGEEKLIKYLLKHQHTSPFEHSMFTFYTKVPLFVIREWHRHRTWKFNEVSGRYVIFEPEYYLPNQFRTPAATNKQGSIFPVDVDPKWYDVNHWNEWAEETIKDAFDHSFDAYEDLLSEGVAKEMARMVLPLNLYTEMFATIDAHNLMKFIELRNAPDAQWEIQQYGKALEEMFKLKMPVTYEAWNATRAVATTGTVDL